MIVIMVGSLIYVGVTIFKESKKRKAYIARQKIIKNKYYIYINNYDEEEFNEKVRKVQDADRQ